MFDISLILIIIKTDELTSNVF